MEKKSFKDLSFSKQLLLILGIFCIVWGLLFIYLAFDKEKLDDGSKIDEVTEYKAEKPKLSIGEVKVIKTTEYLKDAEYKLIYKNYMNNRGNIEVLDKSSGIQIADILGTGYEFVKKSIKVNGSNYTDKNKIKVNVTNGVINIDIPNDMATNVNVVELKIKLTQNTSGIKYFTSQDAYYNFVPNAENKFYGKKTPQSYLIEGNGYIKIK